MTDERSVSRSAVVDATPEQIFELLADARSHHDVDGSGTVRGVITAPDRLTKGATFTMRMRIGVPYPTRNTVIEFDEGRSIAWRHVGRHVWRWELVALEPAGGHPRTEVTETFDWSGALAPLALEAVGYPARNTTNLERSLERLQEHFSSQS